MSMSKAAAETSTDSLGKYESLMLIEVNSTLEKAGLYAGLFGILNSIAIFSLEYLGVVQNLVVPAIWAFVCGAFSMNLYAMAKMRRIQGWLQYAVFFPFISLPTILFIFTHFYMPGGAATYITGAPSYLYFVLIIITGFLFDRAVSIAAGFIAAIEYFAMFLLGHAQLLQVSIADEIMYQDFTSPPVFFFKAFMMVLAGFLIGIISSNTRALISKILAEEHEKQSIDRLFGQFVSAEVKDKIVREKRDVLGERKTVVVLFSDIRGFTSLSEAQDPDQFVAQLNEYFDKMVECIRAHGGVIDKFIGDAIMAVFGGVLELDDPCAAALDAAEAMRDALAELNTDWEARGLPPLRIGIGLHHGEVLQGTIGSHDRKDFTVIGDTVNTSSRLESLTKEHATDLIVSEAVLSRLPAERRRRATDLGEVPIRGKQQAIHIYGFPRGQPFPAALGL